MTLGFRLTSLVLLSAAAAAAGCSTSQPPVTMIDFQPIPLEEASPALAALFQAPSGPKFASLGAGDALGRAVYVNNIILAARMQGASPPAVLVDVPVDQTETP